MKQMSRRDARIKAYELIFMIENSDDIISETEKLKTELKDHKKHYKYIFDVVSAVKDNLSEIDSRIQDNLSEGWELKRLSKMCIATLRLALGEIMFVSDIPENVAINEAVEIIKLFGDENEPAFVNGVLGKVCS